MTKRILFILAVAALLPLSRFYAQNEPPPMPRGNMGTNNMHEWQNMTAEQRFEHFSDKLDLTDEQKPKVKAIFDDWHAAMKEAKTNAFTQLESVLTPEQFQKFQFMIEHKRHAHFGGMESGTNTNEDENAQ